ENVDLVGVRDVIGKEGLDRVFEVLRAPFTEEPTNWSRRYKANLEKLASGDVIKVSEVVRDLWRRDQDRGLSAGEKRMLAKAKQILISELALAEKTDEERASVILAEVLAS
ncbi:MAG: CarD family transcriptional regulator, partial [Microbacterium chocolatum]|nr:CarD family transcriptional regulator [Microbacterium chocolatum]